MWKFVPILKRTIWGGDKIALLKGLPSADPVGESWEVSGLTGSESVVASGSDRGLALSELIARHGSDLLGEGNYEKFGNRFPLLVKFIDAADDLSVQVHPDNEKAILRGLPNGKAEMWYVMQADPGARLSTGFLRGLEKEEFRSLALGGDVEQVLRTEEVAPGDAFYIPGRRVHAIGKGCLIAEIQQTLDATFRVYDYGRRDAQGHTRELHLPDALDTIDFNDISEARLSYSHGQGEYAELVDSPYFTVNLINGSGCRLLDISSIGSFVLLVATEGCARLRTAVGTEMLRAGETVLIGACEKYVEIEPVEKFCCLETFVRQ